MGLSLSHDEHVQLLDCTRELHACRSLHDFPRHVLRVLAPIIPSNLSAFNEVNMPRGRIVSISDRPISNYDRVMETWEALSGQHPLVRYVVQTGDGQAIKFSDFLSEDEYHALDLYRSLYALLEAEDQICLTIRSDAGVLIALAFNRPERSFTESERVQLNLIRPHILQAYANVLELADHLDEKRDLHTALRETGHGLIAVDARDRIVHATPGATECLTRFFPDAGTVNELPDALTDWLASDSRTPFTLHGRAATLIVRTPAGTERRLLLLSEQISRRLPGNEPLTPRETEVLRWLADGKSNAAIATILGVATGTVKLHVGSILAKLGVENRTAAAALAREYGLVGRK